MILQTDYTRRIWTGLTTDDWGEADLREGDVIYLMDASECYVGGEGMMYQLPDLGGGGGGGYNHTLSSVPEMMLTNVYGSALSVGSVRFVDPYFIGTNISFSASGAGATKYIYQALTVDGRVMLYAQYTTFTFTYNDVLISEYVNVPYTPSGSGYAYMLTLPADYDPTIPINVTR